MGFSYYSEVEEEMMCSGDFCNIKLTYAIQFENMKPLPSFVQLK